VPNPNPNAITNHPSNLPGPDGVACRHAGPVEPDGGGDPSGRRSPTNYSTFWSANANCYKYKQIIKIIDNQKPQISNCPSQPG
jgi:hypothetical protein